MSLKASQKIYSTQSPKHQTPSQKIIIARLLGVQLHGQLIHRECHVCWCVQGFGSKGDVSQVLTLLRTILCRKIVKQRANISDKARGVLCCDPGKNFLLEAVDSVVQVADREISDCPYAWISNGREVTRAKEGFQQLTRLFHSRIRSG